MKSIAVKTVVFILLSSLIFSCSPTPLAPLPTHTAAVPTWTPIPTQIIPTATLTDMPIPTETAEPLLLKAKIDGVHAITIDGYPTEPGRKTVYITAEHPENARQVAWSPDGTKFVCATNQSGLYIYSLETETLEAIEPTWNPSDGVMAGSVDWSPDGQWIAFGRYRDRGYREPGSSIYLIHPDGTEYHPIYTYIGIGASGVIVGSWTPDSKYLLFYVHKDNMSTRSDLYIVDVAGKRPQKLLSHRPPNITPYIAVSPDGKTIYYYKEGEGPHMSPIDCYYDHSCKEIPSEPSDLFPFTWYKDYTPRWTGDYPTFYEKYGLP